MSKASSFSAMQRAIINYINSRIAASSNGYGSGGSFAGYGGNSGQNSDNRARKGIVSGKRVIIGNKSYPYDVVVDSYFGDGDTVYCILPDSGSIAVIVGVA